MLPDAVKQPIAEPLTAAASISSKRGVIAAGHCESYNKGDKVMSQTTLEMAKELVVAQIETQTVAPDAVLSLLCQTHATLMKLKAKEEGRDAEPQPGAWKHSMTRHTIRCLECGATLKQLSWRHLQRHGLDARSYRVKYGIPSTQPLAAKTTTALRKQTIQRFRPWEMRRGFSKRNKAKVSDNKARHDKAH
jgi:predicted transcriptional regulator